MKLQFVQVVRKIAEFKTILR